MKKTAVGEAYQIHWKMKSSARYCSSFVARVTKSRTVDWKTTKLVESQAEFRKNWISVALSTTWYLNPSFRLNYWHHLILMILLLPAPDPIFPHRYAAIKPRGLPSSVSSSVSLKISAARLLDTLRSEKLSELEVDSSIDLGSASFRLAAELWPGVPS